MDRDDDISAGETTRVDGGSRSSTITEENGERIIELVVFAEGDPEDPKNFLAYKKMGTVLILCLLSFIGCVRLSKIPIVLRKKSVYVVTLYIPMQCSRFGDIRGFAFHLLVCVRAKRLTRLRSGS